MFLKVNPFAKLGGITYEVREEDQDREFEFGEDLKGELKFGERIEIVKGRRRRF